MGMKEYKFLRRSRDLIVKSEQKISRINKKMSKIEQEVVDLKSKKKTPELGLGYIFILSEDRSYS